MSEVVRAPAGWGYAPGCILAGVDASALPNLPLLRMIRDGKERNKAIERAIRDTPGLAGQVRARDIKHKYGLPDVTASVIASRLRA
jgi:hypothetical protein